MRLDRFFFGDTMFRQKGSKLDNLMRSCLDDLKEARQKAVGIYDNWENIPRMDTSTSNQTKLTLAESTSLMGQVMHNMSQIFEIQDQIHKLLDEAEKRI